MTAKMKIKFDKYWGESNLLMSVAAVLDPRCKMRALQFCFPKLYSPQQVKEETARVRQTLNELYSEYVSMYNIEHSSGQVPRDDGLQSEQSKNSESLCGWSEYATFLRSVESIQPQKSELDMYLQENCYMSDKENGREFNVFEWWRIHELKYRILSIMTKDILAIPITSVASEASFSVGSRVIDKFRASLNADTVQVLMCGGDWLRQRFGVKRKTKVDKKTIQIILPFDDEASKDN